MDPTGSLSSLQAAAVALVSQAVALLVAYGVVDNASASKWIALSVGLVNVAALINHGLHHQGQAAAATPPPAAAPAAAEVIPFQRPDTAAVPDLTPGT